MSRTPLMVAFIACSLLVACGGQGTTPAGSSAPAASSNTAVSAKPSPAAPAQSGAAASTSPSAATAPAPAGPLVIYGAGTLANPFKAMQAAFEKSHPGIQVQPQFGGSVKMAKQITELKQPADILAVADYSVIPQELFGQNGKQRSANWYAGFAGNAITFVYTPKSKGADTISADTWYKVLAEPGVQIGRSNPDTDPSGYQTLQMLRLAETYYHQPGLYDAILKNAPQTNMRDTETELLSALQAGQIDYLAIYRSDAQQNHVKDVPLPPQIDLSDAKYSADYAKVTVTTKAGNLRGKPIVYALTVPDNAPHPTVGRQFVAFALSKDGTTIMQQNGFVPISPPYASDMQAVPADLRTLLQPWPAS